MPAHNAVTDSSVSKMSFLSDLFPCSEGKWTGVLRIQHSVKFRLPRLRQS